MAADDSSRRRHTKKAGTRSRSTTSSTTGSPAGPAERKAIPPVEPEVTSESGDVEHSSEPPLLTRPQQREFLQHLQRVASPLACCAKLGVSLESYDLTRERDAHFRRQVERLFVAFDENVNAALYRDAMDGVASAQANYLKVRSATQANEDIGGPRGRELAEMSTEELLACQARLSRLGGEP